MKKSLICLLCSSLCLASLEQEYTEDTAKCVETAKAKHVDNPNAGLDHFVNCILAQLQSVRRKVTSRPDKISLLYCIVLYYSLAK